MRLHHWLFRPFYRDENDGEGGDLGGGSSDNTPTDNTPSDNAPAANTSTDTSSTTAAKAPVDPDAPKSMLEAIDKGLDKANELKPADNKTGDGKPEAKPAEKNPAEQAEDPLKMPEGLHVKAQARFQQMVSMVKEKDQQIEQLTKSSETAHKAAGALGSFIRETGATGEQFAMMSQYLKAANSGDVETEYNLLVGRLRELQMQTGRTFDNLPQQTDPLQAFPDLAQAVASYQITRERAMELARFRGMEQQQQQVTAQQREQQAEAQQWVQAKDDNIGKIRDWEKQMAATDPDYAQVAAVMRQNKQGLEWVVRNTPPNQWNHHMTMLYNQTKAARQAWVPPGATAPRPLSGSVGKPQGTGKAPNSMFDAMFPNG